jgi:hypothetical protein
MRVRDPDWILRIWREAAEALLKRQPSRRGQHVVSSASLNNARARIAAALETEEKK